MSTRTSTTTKTPSDIQDLIENPDLIVTSTSYGVESAFAYWFSKKRADGLRLSTIARTGTVSEVTQIVNGGQNGYIDRKNRFNALASVMGIPQEA